jgi:serine/threonine protein kinase
MNRGSSEGVDPTAATLHREPARDREPPRDVFERTDGGSRADLRASPPEPRTLMDRKSKRYSEPKKNPRRVEADGSGEIDSTDFHKRYVPGKQLGEGSMGEVVVVRDTRVLRDVAMKRLHHEHHSMRPDLRDRFLREARVQGQLEHPSVVPVYEIGTDHEGREYFTMKRVRGRTLEQIIKGLREGDPEFGGKYSRRKLLTSMSRICLAVAFAHERGVVHRDLKPANIMLGDYGEVHLLDWGIAKIIGLDDPTYEERVDTSKDRVQGTEVGFVVGTPGYMAPEQARGETRTYAGRSDIYSLGCILFEAMTLERLHDQPLVENILLSTVSGTETRPSVRAPHLGLPIELDEIVTRATSLNPEGRYSTAREMNDAIEKLLDGDRDSTRRAEIAAEHTANAKAALALARRGGKAADGMHRQAVGELLQALALEPNHAEARATMVQLLLEPVEKLPAEAFVELQEVNRLDRARASRANGWAYLAWMGTFPLIIAMGVREPWKLWSLGAAVMMLIAYTWWMATTGRTQPRYMIVAVLYTFAVIGSMSMFFGPLFFVPGLAVTAATTYLVAIRANRRARAIVLMGSLSAVLIPTILHLTGLSEVRYVFDGQGMTLLPGLVELPERATWAFLLVANCLTVIVANVLVARAVSALLRAERRLFTQAWRLRQFLPELAPTDKR